ncbi:MAG: rod shape-determining protein MreD [Betaproteobacteria bacterium]|nr:rod shape-determining protein MreD [Betaproteobacteria bacterium]
MPAHSSAELLKPVSGRFVAFTLIAAVVLNLLPWFGPARLVRPDFVVLCLLYWSIHQPRKVGIGVSWLTGLVMDAATGSLFGAHALVYALVIFAAMSWRRRILRFSLLGQAVHILVLMGLLDALLLGVQATARHAFFAGWGYFASAATSALLWPVLSEILLSVQRARSNAETA